MIFDKILSSSEQKKLYLGGLELNNVSNSYTREGDSWVFGAKVATKDSISSQINSSALNVNALLRFSDTTSSNFFNVSLPVYLNGSDITNNHYSLLDINDSIRWWISFDGVGASNLGFYNSYNQVSGSGGSTIS